MAQASNTITLKGDGQYVEGKAAAAITPGHLVRRTANADELAVHNVSGGNVTPAMFALEYDIIGRDITDAYAATEQVIALIPEKGAWIYALVPAGAAAIARGDLLQSNGDGTLIKYVAQQDTAAGGGATDINPARIAGMALEAVNNSGGGSPARIRIEIV